MRSEKKDWHANKVLLVIVSISKRHPSAPSLSLSAFALSKFKLKTNSFGQFFSLENEKPKRKLFLSTLGEKPQINWCRQTNAGQIHAASLKIVLIKLKKKKEWIAPLTKYRLFTVEIPRLFTVFMSTWFS